MIYLDQNVAIQLNHFRTAAGSEALAVLAKLILEDASKKCTLAEGKDLYRSQGEARLANWLLNLPKGLYDASNAASSEPVG